MTFKRRHTEAARGDIKRLYAYLLDRDLAAADTAVDVIVRAVETLQEFPFSTRKAPGKNSRMRELLIPFGSAGYVALFEIEDDTTISILAVRHQRQEDYH